MRNEILDEVWRTRDALARRYGHDLGRLAAALREREARETRPVVDRSHGPVADVAAKTAVGRPVSGVRRQQRRPRLVSA